MGLMGYDAMEGNPLSIETDPGFRNVLDCSMSVPVINTLPTWTITGHKYLKDQRTA